MTKYVPTEEQIGGLGRYCEGIATHLKELDLRDLDFEECMFSQLREYMRGTFRKAENDGVSE